MSFPTHSDDPSPRSDPRLRTRQPISSFAGDHCDHHLGSSSGEPAHRLEPAAGQASAPSRRARTLVCRHHAVADRLASRRAGNRPGVFPSQRADADLTALLDRSLRHARRHRDQPGEEAVQLRARLRPRWLLVWTLVEMTAGVMVFRTHQAHGQAGRVDPLLLVAPQWKVDLGTQRGLLKLSPDLDRRAAPGGLRHRCALGRGALLPRLPPAPRPGWWFVPVTDHEADVI